MTTISIPNPDVDVRANPPPPDIDELVERQRYNKVFAQSIQKQKIEDWVQFSASPTATTRIAAVEQPPPGPSEHQATSQPLTATQKTWNTYELVEMILLQLPAQKILQLQQLNRRTHYVVLRSRELKIKLFARAPDTWPSPHGIWNPFLKRDFLTYPTLYSHPSAMDDHPNVLMIDPFVGGLMRWFLPLPASFTNHAVMPEVWRRMLVCQNTQSIQHNLPWARLRGHLRINHAFVAISRLKWYDCTLGQLIDELVAGMRTEQAGWVDEDEVWETNQGVVGEKAIGSLRRGEEG